MMLQPNFPHRYTPGPDADVLLARWWAAMGANGDLDLFGGLAESLGAFFRAFLPPARLYYMTDGTDIVGAVWADPVHTAAFVSVWVKPEYRQRRLAVFFVIEALANLVLEYPVLVALSRSEKLQRAAAKLGFTPLSPAIPWLLHGQPAFVSFLTAKDFLARWRGVLKPKEDTEHGG